ncbi:AAA family ATPase [Vibrio hepatarius]|uniref:AAA family ATPase n=1 Tax=Vibrio hepatarius TaxID=171383 RepID=UPI00148BF51C|nr:AAA family ATPase [Vibrio hepatarius]NOI12406.1 AAA family ATPase [Vibrio hepatarius]
MLKPVELNIDKSEIEHKSLRTNLTVWVVYATQMFKNHIESELSKCISINLEWLDLSTVTMETIANKRTPDLIYIESGDNWVQKIAHVYSSEGSLQHNQTSLVVFGDEHDATSLKMALKLGASDYLSRSAEIGELYPFLQDLAHEKIATKTLGELSLFINTKGGSGATTLALNTAISLSSYTAGNVLLVDLDMQFNDAADYINSKPKYSINDVVDNLNDLDEMSLDGLVFQHESGLNYLGFSQDNIQDNYKRATEVVNLIPILRQFYSHIIIDMSHGVEHVFQKAVTSDARVYLVMQQNVTSIKHAANYVKSLQLDYGLSSEQVKLIVNRFDKKVSISLKDIEGTFPNKDIHLVPNDFAVAMECSNLGTPIVKAKKNTAIKSALIDLSHLLETPQERVEKSWIGRLFS